VKKVWIDLPADAAQMEGDPSQERDVEDLRDA